MTPLPDRAQMEALLAKASGDVPNEAVREIFREIFATCLSLESPATVSFCGLEGAFAHAAARSRFGQSAEFVACETVSAALDEVTRQRATYAVVPYETQTDGLMQATIGALTQSDLKIMTCFEVVVNLQLASKAGSLAEIEKVYAIAKDRAHCQKFLANELPGAQILDVKTPAGACQLAAADPRSAAFAHESVASQHGLEILRKNVRDEGDERVRYTIIGTRPPSRSGNDLTALILSVADAPGALHEVLEAVRRARREPHEDPIAPHAGRDVAIPLLHRGPGPSNGPQRRRRARRRPPAGEVLQSARVVSSDRVASRAE